MGDGHNVSSFNPNAFKISLFAPAGYSLKNLTVNLAAAVRQQGKGYSPLDGFGLIDALSAVNAVP